MDILKLEVPQQTYHTADTLYANFAKVKTWLSTLPTGDAGKAAQELLAFLQRLNRSIIETNDHYRALTALAPYTNDLIAILSKQYSSSGIPLPQRMLDTSLLVRDLLTEQANGYKQVVLEITRNQPKNDRHDKLNEPLHAAIDALSRLLVANYEIYATPPKNIWFEINQLYRHAEKHGMLSTPLPASGHSPQSTIELAYHRIALMALADPNHLMQGETATIYSELRLWATGCKISHLNNNASPQGKLCVDLNSDLPPRYMPRVTAIQPSSDYRILDISAALTLVDTRRKELMATLKTSDGARTTLAERRMRDIFNHLTMAWSARSERQFERTPQAKPVEFTLGIGACHTIHAAGNKFTPEVTDLKLRAAQSGKAPGFDLALMPEDQSPWLSEDTAQQLRTGIVTPHTSNFTGYDSRDEKDMWVKVYTSSVQRTRDDSPDPIPRTIICEQQDASRDGLSLHCPPNQAIQLRVGELIGFKTGNSSQANEWLIGSVRWLQSTHDNHIDLGIRKLADSALSIATKGIKGVGEGGDYIRALLVPRLDPMEYATTLIAPAAIYDVHSILLVNTGTQLLYVQLKKLLESTGSYARFQFTIAEPPEQTRQSHVS